MKFNKKTVFITLFAVLYLCVGLVSTIHAVSFFGLANSPLLGIILAVTFEVGQAAVLFNLLTTPSQRKRIMPWALMLILTLVQILGNIFSSYKYLITNSSSDLRYFKEPIFTWVDLPDEQCNVIITYIVGAILPIVALCLTEMVVSYLGNETKKEEETKEETKEENKEKETEQVEQVKHEEKNEVKIEETTKSEEPIIEKESNNTDDVKISEDTLEAVDDFLKGSVKNNKDGKPSHFINI